MATTIWTDTPDLGAWRRAGGVVAALCVRDVMSWPAIVLDPRMNTAFAVRVASEHEIHHFPVVLRGDLVGVVCTCDLDRATATDPIATHMSQRVVTVSPSASLSEAAMRMDDEGVNSLLCLWRGGWGIVTRGDLVRAGACESRMCSACGATHHVRRHPLYEEQWYCVDCIEPRSEPALGRYYDELGEGD